MTDRAIHLPVAEPASVDQHVRYARLAEERGYERVWLPETWGRNAVSVLTTIARETETIGIGTSILNVFSRSPGLVAQSAASLQEVSDGRFRLGIGPSGPAVVEGWHGAAFERPLRRTREYLDVVRRALAGDTVDYDGECVTLGGFRLRSDPPDPAPPVDVAGMGPKAVELAGRFADGWHATVFTPDGLRDRLDDFRRGLSLGDRASADVRTTLSLTACALDESARARRLGREHLAFYLGSMGTYYRDSLARQGYEETATSVAAAWASGDRGRALDALDDAFVDEVMAVGSPARAAETLSTFEAIDGLDEIAVGVPRGAAPDDVEATIRALAPER